MMQIKSHCIELEFTTGVVINILRSDFPGDTADKNPTGPDNRNRYLMSHILLRMHLLINDRKLF